MKQFNLYAGMLKLMGLLVLLPLTGYMLAVNKTVAMYYNLKIQERLTYTIPNKSNGNSEDTMVFSKNEDIKSGAVLKTLNKYTADNSTVTDSYTPTLNYKSNGFSIYTGELVLSGGFNSLTGLIGKLENEKREYRIASVQYKTVSDPRKHSTKLQVTIIIQQVIKI